MNTVSAVVYTTGSKGNGALYLSKSSMHVHDHVWKINGKRSNTMNRYE
jgi:hypothetical protein